MAIRFYYGKRHKLDAEADDYALSGRMKIVDNQSTEELDRVEIRLDETHRIEIDREDLIKMYEFMMKPRKP